MSGPQRTVIWQSEHEGWEIEVARVAGDDHAHVVIFGPDPSTGLGVAHAERQLGATTRSIRAWIDDLIAAGSCEIAA